MGRYVSADPIGQWGGVNVYTYGLNSPTNLVDPLGLEVTMVCRPLSGPLGHTGKKHCTVIVWHWECGKKVVDRQYTVEFGGRTPLPQDVVGNPTFDDDRAAWENPGGPNEHYPIPPPPGVSQAEHDRATTEFGDNYSQGRYWPISGPNSNRQRTTSWRAEAESLPTWTTRPDGNPTGVVIADNSVYLNGGDGILVTGGTVTGNSSHSNVASGILTYGDSLIQRNLLHANAVGLFIGTDSDTAWRENVITGNTTATVVPLDGVDMGANSCNGAATCP